MVRVTPLGRLRRRAARAADEAQSTLLVPVPEVEPLLGSLRGVVVGADGLPPHITVLYPFLPVGQLDESVAAAVAEVVAGHQAFDFALTGLGTFPGVVWLRPEPAQPFLELGDAVLARWPTLSRYGGRYAEAVAHLTVARGRLRRSWRARIEAAVPVMARARAVVAMIERPGGNWELWRRFPLASSGEDRS